MKLNLVYNEAIRQQSINTYYAALAFNEPQAACDEFKDAMKVHGPYTSGFFEDEWAALKDRLKSKAGD